MNSIGRLTAGKNSRKPTHPWRSGAALLLLLVLLGRPAAALAAPGLPPLPYNLWRAWSLEPQILLGLLVTTWAYWRGVRQLWSRAGPGRVIRRWQVVAFGLGLLALGGALISPLSQFATALFSAHMVQHVILMLVVAPLLVLGAPVVPFLWALPRPLRQRLGRGWLRAHHLRRAWERLTQPLLVWFFYAVILWGWHLPILYQAALEQEWVHELEHGSFLGISLLFWWLVIHPAGGHRRLSYGASALFLFTTALHSGALGALITFARIPFYPIYTSSVTACGLTLLEDQQLAGAIMWIPAGMIYTLAALILLGAWIERMDHRLNQSYPSHWPPNPGCPSRAGLFLEAG